VGVFNHKGPLCSHGKFGYGPGPVAVVTFIIDNIEIIAFLRIEPEPDVGQDRINGTVVLNKCGNGKVGIFKVLFIFYI